MLDQERRYYDEHVQEWLEQFYGQYVVIYGCELIDVFATFDEALSEGMQRFSPRSFLLREVLPERPPARVPALTLGVLRAGDPFHVLGSNAR